MSSSEDQRLRMEAMRLVGLALDASDMNTKNSLLREAMNTAYGISDATLREQTINNIPKPLS